MPETSANPLFEEAKPVTYTWPLYWHVLRFVPWLLLLLLVVASGSVRTGAWKAALPGAVLLVALVITDLYWGEAAYYVDLFALLAYSLSCLWLMSGRMARLHSAAAPGLAFLWLVAAGVVYLLFSTGLFLGLTLSPDGMSAAFTFVGLAIAQAVVAMVIVLAFLIARRMCRKRFTWLRFHVWTLVAAPALTLLALPLIVAVVAMQVYVYDEDFGVMLTLIGMAMASLLATAAAVYAVLFPYLVITQRTPVLRERFYEILRLDQPRRREWVVVSEKEESL